MDLFNPKGCFCEKCDRKLAFRKTASGKWCPCEPDGSDHWDICRETQVKLGRLSQVNSEPGMPTYNQKKIKYISGGITTLGAIHTTTRGRNVMNKIIVATQDAKYGIEVLVDPANVVNLTARLVNIATGKAIPEDEPVFMLRAKDVFAEQTIAYYLTLASQREHRASVVERIGDFTEFRINNCDLMKAPDTVYPFPKVGR